MANRAPSRALYLHQYLEWRTFTVRCRKVGSVFWVLDANIDAGDKFYHEGIAYRALSVERSVGAATRIRTESVGEDH